MEPHPTSFSKGSVVDAFPLLSAQLVIDVQRILLDLQLHIDTGDGLFETSPAHHRFGHHTL